ncbi:hypothetical protein CLW00_103133 [Mongoliibacter ruber]|uniref:Uncharacterized protein n=2 Tax=Mongoliibacter ruber TaxID=1750599 RepID=A0A2T0WQM3_9BACT|nr:hypothetical protein CLW00_103133 [Mongoliibacter ruber]
MLLVFNSCTNFNRAVHTKKSGDLEKPLEGFLILFVETDNEILQLDEEFYNKSIRGKFNNLEHRRFRDHLASATRYTFDAVKTFDSKDFFEVHQDYSFEEFNTVINDSDFQHLLIISMRNNMDRGEFSQQNFQVYLFDKGIEQPLWTGFGYYNQGNIIRRPAAQRLSNRIKRDLKSDGMLM